MQRGFPVERINVDDAVAGFDALAHQVLVPIVLDRVCSAAASVN